MQSSAIVEVIREMVANLKLKSKDVAVSISGHSVIIKKSASGNDTGRTRRKY